MDYLNGPSLRPKPAFRGPSDAGLGHTRTGVGEPAKIEEDAMEALDTWCQMLRPLEVERPTHLQTSHKDQ